MTHTLNTPNFKSEKEKAEWWDNLPDELFAMFKQAEKDGTLGRGTRAAIREGIAQADQSKLIENDDVRQWLENQERS